MGSNNSKMNISLQISVSTALLFVFLVSLKVSAEDTLPAESAISWSQIQSAAVNWGNGAGTEEESSEESAVGGRRLATFSHRDRLHMDDYYYEQCVYHINVARAREGLPALQRWKDFEPCADRGARFDMKNNKYHGSIVGGLYCDWENYFPVSQNSCPMWHAGSDSNESCTKAMWAEKDLLELKVVDGKEAMECINGKSDPGQCAGHYLNMRGGELGYNAYDRVACGFYKVGNEIWINHNFGSAIKTRVEDLKTAEEWNAPLFWLPEWYQRYGFACGGDEDTVPPKLLVGDCEEEHFDEMRYDGCGGSYRHDYRWYACVEPTCDSSYNGPCEDLTVSNDGTVHLDGSSGEDVCSQMDLEAPCIDPLSFEFPKGSKRYLKTSFVCRKSCQTCGCPTKPFEIGFTPTAMPTPEPTNAFKDTFAPSFAPTFTPDLTTAEPTRPVRCGKYKGKGKCRGAFGCSWGRRGPCEPLEKPCEELSKVICKGSYGCTWLQKPKKNRGCYTSEDTSASD